MAFRRTSTAQPASAPADTLEVELARIGAMNIDQLRAAWREALASDPPPAFSQDLLAHAIAFHAQQKALGGLSPPTARLLRSLIKPGVEPPRQVKVGSVNCPGASGRRLRGAGRPRRVLLARQNL